MKKLFALLALLAMLTAMFAGCAQTPTPSETPEESAAPSEAAPSEAPTSEAPADAAPTEEAPPAEDALYVTGESEIPYVVTSTKTLTYPLTEEEFVLTGAAQMDNNFYAYLPEDYFASGYGYKKAAEVTGIRFECESYGMDSASTKIGLMIAAEDTPDIILDLKSFYATGVDGLLEDEVVYDLQDYIEQYAPDFYAYWESNSTYRSLALSESGALPAIYSAPNTLGYESAVSPFGYQGIITRADWMADLGYTIDDLKTYDAFEKYAIEAKDKYQVEIPIFTGTAEATFLYGYDLCGSFSVESDGKVSYDLTSDSYREYIEMYSRWYSEGLLDADFMLNGLTIGYGDAMSAGMTLAICRDAASHMTPQMIEVGRQTDPDFDLCGLAIPGKTPDWENKYGGYWADSVSNGWFITTTCDEERIPYALGYINYFFTEDGIIAGSYGEEGVTWNRGSDGGFEFTDLIRSPESIPPFFVSQAYCGVQLTGITVAKPPFFDLQCQEEANTLWGSNLGDERVFKGVLTSEERQATGTAMTDIATLQQERLYQFIFGELTIEDNWDAYVTDCYNIGLQDVLDTYQAAQDRFVAKFGA